MALEALSDISEDSGLEDELQPGTVLFHGQYTITRFISSGGFGITYLAKDRLKRDVVIKECFVSAYCRRSKSRVRPRSLGSKADVDMIVRHFLDEAQRMAALTHPNIVGVRQVFEENDTAYMAMDYIQGRDLQDIIDDPRSPLGPLDVVALAQKLVPALGYVHHHGILHCDISPDNIFIDPSGEPILIDFGAARLVTAGISQQNSGPLVVKDGYSPQELYFNSGKTGPWTDIYALAATLAHAVTGAAPAQSQLRLAAVVERRPDPQLPLAGRFPGYPTGFLDSIDKALAVMPSGRFQTTDEWLKILLTLDDIESTNVKLFRRAPRAPAPERPTHDLSSAAPAETAQKPATPQKPKGTKMAINLSAMNEISGFIGGCVVDSETGFMMASEGGGKLDLEAASAANTEVVRAKLRAIEMLGLNDSIEDILITLGKQLHLIRPLEKTPTVFIYVALDKKAANLGMARVQVKKVEQSVTL